MLGTVAIICSLCLALFSQSVRDLFLKRKETIRFAIPLCLTIDEAATVLQTCLRSYLGKKAHRKVENAKLAAFRFYCNLCSDASLSQMPRATNGNTPVYFPQQAKDIVLKKIFSAFQRLTEMNKVREILKNQNSTHLIVPTTFRVCRGFLIEQRLPIDPDNYHNIGLYFFNQELFDEPVRELTRLFSQIELHDLIASFWQKQPISNIKGVKDTVRYDNLPFFVINRDGKKEVRIGLIDLEQITYTPSPEGLCTLVRIFPFHRSIILEEARKNNIKVEAKSFEDSFSKGERYLNFLIRDHLEWLKKKGISTTSIPDEFKVPDEILPELHTCVSEKLKEFSLPHNKQNAEAIVKNILSSYTAKIRDYQNQKTTIGVPEEIIQAKIIDLRSPVLRWSHLYKNLNELMEQIMKEDWRKQADAWEVMKQLSLALMKRLKELDIIFFLDEEEYGFCNYCWLRY